ncbi:hypothetical protein DCC85_11495 [Paenibacillus sp. CAA11]|uniref:hypothetical protein n=1 Tax=Paenibacillus sp. CAA11 TaxID=1532905 RepID=UPI000D35C843|nr:hypothetical protein [Paenibacillus sp. CAA11]AWB44779.1 hypothetical protein DCC85_11495 [Paenibacillus sp. CAA11]
MNITITNATMTIEAEGSFLGSTVFTVEGHDVPYEITFFSKNGKDWDYSLHFFDESGDEDKMLLVDEYIEGDNDSFDDLLDAAIDTMPGEGE